MTQGIWTPGQRPPGQVDVGINGGPHGFSLSLKGLGLIVQPDGTISTPPAPLEAIESLGQTIVNVAAGLRGQMEEQRALAATNGAPRLAAE